MSSSTSLQTLLSFGPSSSHPTRDKRKYFHHAFDHLYPSPNPPVRALGILGVRGKGNELNRGLQSLRPRAHPGSYKNLVVSQEDQYDDLVLESCKCVVHTREALKIGNEVFGRKWEVGKEGSKAGPPSKR